MPSTWFTVVGYASLVLGFAGLWLSVALDHWNRDCDFYLKLEE